MNKKIIEINDKFYIKITWHDGKDSRHYTLYNINENEEIAITESFNRDSFLLKVKNYVKINNKLECLIASY